MKSTNFNLVRYDADEGKVFDWVKPRYAIKRDSEGRVLEEVQTHLYAKTLFIGPTDSISNYIEVDEPVKED